MTVKRQQPHTRSHRLFLLSLICIAGMFLLSACTGADGEFLADLAKSWVQDTGLINADGSPNYGEIAKAGAKKLFTGTSGDSTVDAALTAGPVVKNIHDADKLAEQGATAGGEEGLQAIDNAIEMRPNDWRYWEQKGALLLAEGRAAEAKQAFDHSNSLVQQHIDKGADCKMYTRNLLYQRQDALTTQVQRYYDLGQDPPAVILNRLHAVQADISALNSPSGPCG